MFIKRILLIGVIVITSISIGDADTPDLEEADLLYESGQYNQARELYRKIVSDTKKSGDASHALFQIGQCLTAEGKYSDAIEIFEGLMKRYPRSKEAEGALYRKGCILTGFLKDVPKGIKVWEELLRLYPHGEYADDALYFIASVQFARKYYKDAKDSYNKFLKMYPASPYSNVARENMEELEKSTGKPVLKGKPIEIVSQNNVHTITRNDTQPVNSAIGDGGIYRFKAQKGGAWKTDMHTHGVWMASPDGTELVWVSDNSGLTASLQPPCPGGGGGTGSGGDCDCGIFPPSCTIDTITILRDGTPTEGPDKICVGDSPAYTCQATGTGAEEGGALCEIVTSDTPLNQDVPGEYEVKAKATCTHCYGQENQYKTIQVIVIGVVSVTVDKTIACVGENVTFTAASNPTGEPLSCIAWESRYRTDSTANWGSWTTASGEDNTAVLNTTTSGIYQYRARNGSGDTFKVSPEITIVKVEVGDLTRVPKFNMDNPNDQDITVTLTPSPLPSGVSVTLEISTTSGSGSATFDNGATTKTITQTTTVKVRGATNSDIKDNIELAATLGTTECASDVFSVRTWPVNFHQTAGYDSGNGNLHFEYEWDSESGDYSDLITIILGEIVDFPGTGPIYYWSSPPYEEGSNSDDPTIQEGTAETGSGEDDITHPGFRTPYANDDFTATQIFRFRDPVLMGAGTYQNLMDSISIRYKVFKENNIWKFRVEKSGVSAQINLP